MKTARSFESLNEFWSPKCGSAEIKQCQLVIRPDVGVLWVGQWDFSDTVKKKISFSNGKKITVIGGSGLVGTNLCRQLSLKQQDFEIIDLRSYLIKTINDIRECKNKTFVIITHDPFLKELATKSTNLLEVL